MSRREYIRAAFAIAAMDHFSPVVRAALMDEADFRSEYHVTTDAIVNFGKEGIGFPRRAFFEVIRTAFAKAGAEVNATDSGGGVWSIQILRDKEPAAVAVAQGERRMLVTHLALLAPDKETRIGVFRHSAEKVNLPAASRELWESVLAKRPPDDNEIGLIQDDLNETPVIAREVIRDNLASGTFSLDVLVPRSIRYYERLVGRCGDVQNIEDYVHEVAVPLMRANIEWEPFGGFQFALLLTSQPAFSFALAGIEVETELVCKIFDWAATKGDAISRAACIEIGVRRIARDPLVKEPLLKVIDSFVKNTPVAHVDQFKLLSALFLAVLGEMSLRSGFAAQPPFWRRLAALAQAAMIARQIIADGHDATEVTEWLMSIRAGAFTLQCYVDMRLEPRWFAELAMPAQMRNELMGRAWMVAKSSEEVVAAQGWTEILLGEGKGTLLSQFKIAEALLPGPLEGGSDAVREMPKEIFDIIRADLSAMAITAASLISLAHATLLYRPLPELVDLANLAAAAIARADYRLDTDDPTVPLDAIVFGAACVAAVTRSHALADALFIVLRKYRRFYPDELSIDNIFRVAMVASASRQDLHSWTKCVGGCMNDMAFQKIAPEEANSLHSHLVYLCHLVPELWATCGQAEAALQAVLGS
jgi:hypothetical protein